MTDQLSIYNSALMLLGERRLADLDENVPSRHALDASWNGGAVKFCLETVKPTFARKFSKLETPTPVTGHGSFIYQFNNPDDWVSTIGWYSDEALSHNLERFLQVGDGILVESSTPVFLRYVTEDIDIELWDQSFTQLVAAYLAREIAPTIDPNKFPLADGVLKERVQSLLVATEENDRTVLTKQRVGTLTTDWMNLYNDALLLLGLGSQKITDPATATEPRVLMDVAITAGLVEELLEDIGWFWAQSSTKTNNNPSINPEWGYAYGHDLPDDLIRLEGVFSDEYMRLGVERYEQESSVIYTDLTILYIKYVSINFMLSPASWPAKFRRLVSAKLARDVAPSMPGVNMQRLQYIEQVYRKRESETKSADVMQSPPRVIGTGDWVGARGSYNRYRGRP